MEGWGRHGWADSYAAAAKEFNASGNGNVRTEYSQYFAVGYYYQDSQGRPEIRNGVSGAFRTFIVSGDRRTKDGNNNDWLKETLGYTSQGLGATGLGLGIRKAVEVEYLAQARINRQIAGNFSKPISHSLRSLSKAGRRLGYAGLGLTIVDIAHNGVNVSNTIDVVMGGIAFTGWGAPVSATYFLINWGVEIYSGQSIGQHLQGTFTDPEASLKVW